MSYRETHYAVLGIQRDAAASEIVRAFRSRAKRLHPDVSPEPTARDEFVRAKSAYETLRDPVRRVRYDSALTMRAEQAPMLVAPTVRRQRIEDGLIGASVSLAGVGLLYVLALLLAH